MTPSPPIDAAIFPPAPATHVHAAGHVERLDLVVGGRAYWFGIRAFSHPRGRIVVHGFQHDIRSRWWRQRLPDRIPLRIQGFRETSPCLERRPECKGGFRQPGILAREIVRHCVRRSSAGRQIVFGLAGIRRQLLRGASNIEPAPDQRLRQIVGIDHREHPMQVGLVQEQLFDDRRPKTAGYTIAGDDALLQMRRRDFQGRVP